MQSSPIETIDRVAELEQRIVTVARELAIPNFTESARKSDRERIEILEDRLAAVAFALEGFHGDRGPDGARHLTSAP